MADSPRVTAETNTVLQTNYIPPKKRDQTIPVSTPGWAEAANGPYSVPSTCVHNQANQNGL